MLYSWERSINSTLYRADPTNGLALHHTKCSHRTTYKTQLPIWLAIYSTKCIKMKVINWCICHAWIYSFAHMTAKKYELYWVAQLSAPGKGSSSPTRPLSQVKIFNRTLKWIIFIYSDIFSFIWSLADEAFFWCFISLHIFLYLHVATCIMFILPEAFWQISFSSLLPVEYFVPFTIINPFNLSEYCCDSY